MKLRAIARVVAGLLMVGLPFVQAAEEAAPHAEARVVKAAYVYNFTKFVAWGGDAEKRDLREPITIGVIGRDAVAETLVERAPSESGGRPLRVVQIARGEKVFPCQVLYIALSEAPRLDAVLEEVGNRGVLTVSDIPRFAEVGGMIGFVTERERVRIEVNVLEVRAAGLAVSSKLLEVARLKGGDKR